MINKTTPDEKVKLLLNQIGQDREACDDLFSLASGDYDHDQPLFGLEFVNQLLQPFVEEGKLAEDFFGVEHGVLTPSSDFFGHLAVLADGEIKVTMLGLKRAVMMAHEYGCLIAFKLKNAK